MNLNTHSRDILLLEFTRQVALDESGLAHTAIPHKEKLELGNLASLREQTPSHRGRQEELGGQNGEGVAHVETTRHIAHQFLLQAQYPTPARNMKAPHHKIGRHLPPGNTKAARSEWPPVDRPVMATPLKFSSTNHARTKALACHALMACALLSEAGGKALRRLVRLNTFRLRLLQLGDANA